MDKQNVKIEVAPGVKELILREGAAALIRDPQAVKFEGMLYSPADFMENRKEELVQKNCRVEVSYRDGSVKFYNNEREPFADVISGSLKKASIIGVFGINDDKAPMLSDKALAKFFQRNIFYFQDKDVHKKIIDSLMHFTAKVTADITNNKDFKGNAKVFWEKRVENEVPELFTMKAPIYEGYEDREFKVWICTEATSTEVTFYLESPELYRLEEEEKRKLIDDEVSRFESFGCAILYK